MSNALGGLDTQSSTSEERYLVVRDPDDVREVFNRSEDFSSANALVAETPLTPQSLRVLQDVRFALPPVLANNDSESHRGIRRVVAGFFTPMIVAGLEPRMRDLAGSAAARAASDLVACGTVDLVPAVTAHPPAILMLEMLGLSALDIPQLKTWSRDSLELFWGWPADERQVQLARSAALFYEWLRDLVADSVAADEPNLFSALARHGLTTAQICSVGYFLLIAAQETTSQLASTTMFRVLDGTCNVTWAQVASKEAATSAVRHVLATESSGLTARRVASRDTALRGEVIPAGAEILLELTGNHDLEAEATDYSLAFGSGIHRCLGARLAELETVVLLQETAAALPSIRLDDLTPPWTRLLSFRSPRSVTVART